MGDAEWRREARSASGDHRPKLDEVLAVDSEDLLDDDDRDPFS
jgi:hypothetical protein